MALSQAQVGKIGDDEAKFEFVAGRTAGQLFVKISGFWDIADADAYLQAIKDAVSDARRGAGYVSLLVDASDFRFQKKEIQGVLAANPGLRRGDRFGVVVENTLAMISCRRVFQEVYGDSIDWEAFISLPEARAWMNDK